MQPIRQPTLFQMEKLEKAAGLMAKLKVDCHVEIAEWGADFEASSGAGPMTLSQE